MKRKAKPHPARQQPVLQPNISTFLLSAAHPSTHTPHTQTACTPSRRPVTPTAGSTCDGSALGGGPWIDSGGRNFDGWRKDEKAEEEEGHQR